MLRWQYMTLMRMRIFETTQRSMEDICVELVLNFNINMYKDVNSTRSFSQAPSSLINCWQLTIKMTVKVGGQFIVSIASQKQVCRLKVWKKKSEQCNVNRIYRNIIGKIPKLGIYFFSCKNISTTIRQWYINQWVCLSHFSISFLWS